MNDRKSIQFAEEIKVKDELDESMCSSCNHSDEGHDGKDFCLVETDLMKEF